MDGFRPVQGNRMLKKILIFFISLFLVITVFLFITVFVTGPSIPSVSDDIINVILKGDPADELPGESGFAESDGVWIWYKSLNPSGAAKGNILLISGIAADSEWWPPCFVNELTAAGYRVILFDNRSTGMSDWMKGHDNWNYSFTDLARDGIAVLNKLKIKDAHVIGVSMGGMIAQQMAINYPARVRSLVSIMSSANLEDPDLPHIPWNTVRDILRISCRYGIFKSEKNMIKLHLGIWQLFRNSTLTSDDIKSISNRVLFNIRKRRGYHTAALAQQLNAIKISGSRYDGLITVKMPALFIHGRRDPLIPYAHGIKCSQAVRESSLILIDGMGHDIPCSYSKTVAEKITSFLSGAR